MQKFHHFLWENNYLGLLGDVMIERRFKHLKISKNICILMGCFLPKFIMCELKKYRGVMFDDTEYWCKIWRKTDLRSQKWHEKFGKFSPEHSKVSKLGFWWDPLIQSRKCIYKLKTYRGVICHDNEECSRIWKGIDLSVQNWHEKLNEFWPEYSKT